MVKKLNQIISLAPLHLPANLMGLKITRRFWPRAKQWAVFDTSAFSKLPLAVTTYPLPRPIIKRWQIRKYGFHGISHAWAARQASRVIGRPLNKLNLITIHLGAGMSLTAWRQGRPVDTSMGLTPLAGPPMMTRSGSIDPAIPLYLAKHGGLSLTEIEDLLEHRSGLYGLTGWRDMRQVLAAAGQPLTGWPSQKFTAVERQRARAGLEIWLTQMHFWLAGYAGQLSRLDAVIFTGAIGQNAWIRRAIINGVPIVKSKRSIYIPANEAQAMVDQVLTWLTPK
jgi:acetate kinase